MSGCVSVDIFKLEYLRNQWVNHNEILPDTATNSRVICPCASEKLMYNVVNTPAPLFLIGSSSFLQVRRTTINKNIKMSSFKSSENIQKKEGGPDRSFSDNQSSSVTLNELAMKARKIL